MTTIRMKTENVEQIIRSMDWISLQMSVQPSKLKNLAGDLSGSWHGGGAGRFASQLRQIATRMQHTNVDLQRLGIDTSREVSQWLAMDQRLGPSLHIPRPFLNSWLIPGGVAIGGGVSWFLTNPLVPTQKIPFEAGTVYSGTAGFQGPAFNPSVSFNSGAGKSHAGAGVEVGLVDGALFDEELKRKDYLKVGDQEVFVQRNVDVTLLGGEAGLAAGLDKHGKFRAGAFAEATVFEASAGAVAGTAMFASTTSAEVAVGKGELFAGYREGKGVGVGAEFSLGSVEVEQGFNIAGINIGVSAGASLGVAAGVQVGPETKVKLGPFSLGLSIGKAKT